MFRPRLLCMLAPLIGLAGCIQENGSPIPMPEDFEPQINAALVPGVSTVRDTQGVLQPVGSSRDDAGVQSDFIEGLVLVRPRSEADLIAFLERYQGTVISDDEIPEPPASLGITLTADQRRATEYVVKINLATVDLSSLAANAEAAGLVGVVEFSSQEALQTFGAVVDAVAAGFDASPEYLSYSTQAFPTTLFSTQERPLPAGGFNDAFNTTRFQGGGSQSDVTLAWQFLMAHGIQRRVALAIIDDGFWLNADGTPAGADSDLPANPPQYDFISKDDFADGPNTTPCAADNPCFWHGTGSAGVAAGILNNNRGAAGTGGLIADPILLKAGAQRSSKNWAIRTALAWGADVISMSWGGDCNQACRIYDREHTPFDDAVADGSRAVFVAAAGNGRSPGPGMPSVGYDVGDPAFVHPCIEDHVICVGALDNDATTKIGYSNFGSRVSVFAPTNIPVMSYPPSLDAANRPLPLAQASGAEAPRSFGGTSASTPFVAGVAAMMKAINPNLSGDEIHNIIMQTAHPGTAPVTRYINAYAAVRRAAEGIPMVNDRYDPGNSVLSPRSLPPAASFTENNLNLDSSDRDYFRFDVPGRSTMNIELQYPEGLGTVSIVELLNDNGCGEPVLLSETPLGNGRGRRLAYAVAGGPHTLGLRADDVISYNLVINFTAAPGIAADIYEANDTPATARRLYSLSSIGNGLLRLFGTQPRFTVEATLHTNTDVDYYIVRGVQVTTAELVFLTARPLLKLYENESPVTLDVWRLNDDGSTGPLVASLAAGSCAAEPLAVGLDTNVYYLVKVAGGAGRYTLNNGVGGDRRRIPILVRDQIYIVLHPGEPVEKILRQPEAYVFPASKAYSAIRVNSPRIAMRLTDMDGGLISESVADAQGQRLSLAATQVGQVYALQVTPQEAEIDPPVTVLSWEEATPVSRSSNFIVNGGAEDIFGDIDNPIPGWTVIDSADAPRIFFYGNDGPNPRSDGPGPQDRGLHLFAGGDHDTAGMSQTLPVNPAEAAAIDAGRMHFRFIGFFGGLEDEGDYVVATLTFLNASQQALGQVMLPPVTAIERGGESGLFPVEAAEMVPAGTRQMRIELTFHRLEGEFNDGYADNLELVLSEFVP